MRRKKIKKIIKMFEKANVTKMELEFRKFTIKLEKPDSESTMKGLKTSQSQEAANYVKRGVWVLSPLVGTYYDAPNRASNPFVSVGDEVKENDVLCVIEAMKIMNELRSNIRGRVAEIAVSNQSMVQYNQPLIRIIEHD